MNLAKLFGTLSAGVSLKGKQTKRHEFIIDHNLVFMMLYFLKSIWKNYIKNKNHLQVTPEIFDKLLKLAKNNKY